MDAEFLQLFVNNLNDRIGDYAKAEVFMKAQIAHLETKISILEEKLKTEESKGIVKTKKSSMSMNELNN